MSSPAPLPDAPADTPELDLVDLGLPAGLLEAVYDLGFTRPTPIQAAAIPPLLAGRDLTGIAQTGTGKTAAFGLPLLTTVDRAVLGVQAVVLTPTRELALQVAEALESFARRLPGLEVVAVYGGAPYLPQQRALARGAQVVVGTPGRVIDHLERGSLDASGVRFLVLDEADEMLRMGFAEDVETILGRTPPGRQVALFSATMPPPIVKVAAAHLKDPVRIAVTRPSSTVASVRQTFAVVPFRHKIGALSRVLAVHASDAAIVFTRTRGSADEVGAALVAKGVNAATISGDVAQKDRERIVERLRSGDLDVLVATDIAARGLDVERVGLVVNFDVPGEAEAYVHRIGRTGRAGRTGEALTFVTPHEQRRLRLIEKHTRVAMTEVTVPTPADVSAHRVAGLLARVAGRVEAGRLEAYREAVTRAVAEGVDALDLAAALAALAVGDEGPRPRDEDGLAPLDVARGATVEDGRFTFTTEERVRSASRRASAGSRYRVAVGRNHGARPEAIVGAITGEGGLTGKDLGKIDIYSSFSLVEIVTDLTPEAFAKISRAKVAGRPLRIEVDRGPKGGRSTAKATAHPGTHRKHPDPRTDPRRAADARKRPHRER